MATIDVTALGVAAGRGVKHANGKKQQDSVEIRPYGVRKSDATTPAQFNSYEKTCNDRTMSGLCVSIYRLSVIANLCAFVLERAHRLFESLCVCCSCAVNHQSSACSVCVGTASGRLVLRTHCVSVHSAGLSQWSRCAVLRCAGGHRVPQSRGSPRKCSGRVAPLQWAQLILMQTRYRYHPQRLPIARRS